MQWFKDLFVFLGTVISLASAISAWHSKIKSKKYYEAQAELCNKKNIIAERQIKKNIATDEYSIMKEKALTFIKNYNKRTFSFNDLFQDICDSNPDKKIVVEKIIEDLIKSEKIRDMGEGQYPIEKTQFHITIIR